MFESVGRVLLDTMSSLRIPPKLSSSISNGVLRLRLCIVFMVLAELGDLLIVEVFHSLGLPIVVRRWNDISSIEILNHLIPILASFLIR